MVKFTEYERKRIHKAIVQKFGKDEPEYVSYDNEFSKITNTDKIKAHWSLDSDTMIDVIIKKNIFNDVNLDITTTQSIDPMIKDDRILESGCNLIRYRSPVDSKIHQEVQCHGGTVITKDEYNRVPIEKLVVNEIETRSNEIFKDIQSILKKQ